MDRQILYQPRTDTIQCVRHRERGGCLDPYRRESVRNVAISELEPPEQRSGGRRKGSTNASRTSDTGGSSLSLGKRAKSSTDDCSKEGYGPPGALAFREVFNIKNDWWTWMSRVARAALDLRSTIRSICPR